MGEERPSFLKCNEIQDKGLQDGETEQRLATGRWLRTLEDLLANHGEQTDWDSGQIQKEMFSIFPKANSPEVRALMVQFCHYLILVTIVPASHAIMSTPQAAIYANLNTS